ncbi:MAG: hypothetical protein D6722_23810 [Bacteroidetes bacterium]|nr:MAG: hypothetical protein D6722_23810 [Bacteroidota bacterium]
MNRFPLFPLLLIALLSLTACQLWRGGSRVYHQRYFPGPFTDLHFQMPLAEALRHHPDMQVSSEESFRIIYTEEIGREGIQSVAYYFDSDAPRILYELVILYQDAASRDAAAARLLGPPNHEEDEWMLDSQDGYRINAWTYQNKLILAGKIAGTEWEEE